MSRALPSTRRITAGVGAGLAFALLLSASPSMGAEPALATPSSAAEHAAVRQSAAVLGAVTAAPSQKGLLRERVRNTHARFAARFVYVPGVPKFDRLVDRELRAAIRTTKRKYSPQAFAPGAGLGTRGCVPGSTTTWTAKKVLRRSETAPPTGAGTAVTCEVVATEGSIVKVVMRTVRGSQKKVHLDKKKVLYADLSTGAAGTIVQSRLWRGSTPVKVWKLAVEQLRDEALAAGGPGGPVPPALADPGVSQTRLARHALYHAKTDAKGRLTITLPAGIAAPELKALGVARTTVPTVVRVSRATADQWSKLFGKRLRDQIGKPFVGIRKSTMSVAPNCSLLPCVALTYDDGPEPYTRTLLRTLKAREARVTFFMVGSMVSGRESIVRSAAKDGHEIASHTMNHADLTMLSLAGANSQVKSAAAKLRAATGKKVTLFRPPYGAINQQIINRVGMPAILWSVDTNDWRRPGKSALIQRSVPVVRPGGIILFHDIHPDSVAVAGTVISGLRDRGFELVTVTQLFDGKVPLGRVAARYS
ncbi:MAG: polysaccharide deacetylase family protein [Leucobacter sp.]|nr:polysaccharide deacetylase family protein [Leucobacter sp.]